MQELTIVTVTHNSGNVIAAMLDSVRASGAAVIIVDNGSTDRTLQIAAGYPNVRVINNGNTGYGRAANLGFAEAKTPYVLLANPDVVLEEGALDALLAGMRNHPEIGILSANMFCNDSAGHKTYTRTLAFDAEGLATTDWIVGALMVMRREVILGLGGFDENIFLFYEETDLCRRFLAAGHTLAVTNKAEAHHAEGTSSAKCARVFKVKSWHAAWSKAYFYRKYNAKPAYMRKCMSSMVSNSRRMIEAALTGDQQSFQQHRYALWGLLSAMLGVKAFKKGVGRLT